MPLLPAMLTLVVAAGADPPVPEARLVAIAPSPGLDEMSPARHEALRARLRERVRQLTRAGKLDPVIPAGAAGLEWPLEAAPGFAPFGYHGVSGFVDHDPRFPGLLEDYACGTRTYDLATGYNHAGTDYFLWPYPWRTMDEGRVRIVAAAPGVIVERIDGNFDRACAIQGDSGFNAVFVRQDDGLVAWYLHMKNGSVTSRRVGERVAAGDYLGLVGSSGSSSGPHLHFQLEDASEAVVDPRRGACNDAPERWAVFQPYEAPRIDTLTTHSAEPEAVDCGFENGVPVHEEPHFKDRFAPGETVWVFASYSDHRDGEMTRFSLLRPDGSTFASWDFDLADQDLERPFYAGTAWAWSHALPPDAPSGAWTVHAEFEGVVYSHAFEVARASPVRGHSAHARPSAR